MQNKRIGAAAIVLSGAFVFFFPGCIPSFPEDHPEILVEVRKVEAARCRNCNPYQELYKVEGNLAQPNPVAHNFRTVVTKTGKTPYKYIPSIETKRLIFREIRMSDLDELHALLSNQKVIATSIWEKTTSRARTRQLIAKMSDEYTRGETVPWAITEKNSDTLIGIAGFVGWYPDQEFSDLKSKAGGRITTMLMLNPEHWNKQYQAEILKALIEFGITHKIFRIRRVEHLVRMDNQAGRDAAEQAGMMYEGLQKDYHYIDGKPVSFHQYAVGKADITDQLAASKL